MGDFTVVDDGHGLEAPVRVGADAAAAGGGRELVRAGMVQQQKRAEGAAMVAVAEQVQQERDRLASFTQTLEKIEQQLLRLRA